MSCFSCCEEDDIHKATDNGPFMPHNSAGILSFGIFSVGMEIFSFVAKLVKIIFVSLKTKIFNLYGCRIMT